MSRNRCNTLAIAFGCALIACPGKVAPLRWTGLVDVSATCYYAVPADWKIDAASELVNAIAWSADGRAKSVVVRSSNGWTAVVDGLRSTLRAVAVHEDSPQRFWIEYASAWSGTHHLAAIPATGGGCLLYLDLDEKAEPHLHAIIKDIVGTLTALR